MIAKKNFHLEVMLKDMSSEMVTNSQLKRFVRTVKNITEQGIQSMKQGTKTTLIKDIKDIQEGLDSSTFNASQKIIERAENDLYHDFKSQIPMPKMTLHSDLKLIGLDDIAAKVFEGCYDEL